LVPGPAMFSDESAAPERDATPRADFGQPKFAIEDRVGVFPEEQIVWPGPRSRFGELAQIPARPSQHEPNVREQHKCAGLPVETSPILGKAAAPVEPGERSVDHPPFGKNSKALHLI
jgi:hypothetical protein